MSNVTQILSAIENGDDSAANDLLPLVYDELRKLAATVTDALLGFRVLLVTDRQV